MPEFCTVYFDESGTHDSEVVVVAGFVSNETEWRAFTERWEQVLTESRLEYFHMSEFENSQGPFFGWTNNERKSLLNKLLPIIHDHTARSVGCVILKNTFHSILSRIAKQACGDEYGMAALACWRHLGLVLPADVWMDCIMEDGAKAKGAIQNIVKENSKRSSWNEEYRIRSLSFEGKRVAPLQAADILAYELYKQGLQQFGLAEARDMRYPLKQLRKKENQWHYFSEIHLREYNDDIAMQLGDMNK